MRVLHVYSGNLYGGVETYLVTLARLRDLCQEMESEFALCFAGRLSEELQTNNARLHWLGGVRGSRPWTVHRGRMHLRDLLREKSFDAVVCHSVWSQSIFGPVVRANQLPLVFYLHDATTGRHWLERRASRIVPDLVICNSLYTRSSVAQIYPNVRSEVLYCPVVQPEPFVSIDRADTRAELATASDSVVIIQVSRMEAWKGHTLHLEALAKLRHIPGWNAWIVGGAQRTSEGYYLQKLKERASFLGIADRVHFLGQRRDVTRLLAAADIYCQPNLGPEPFGISFVEGLRAGLPIVTTAQGAAEEIVDESCGILVRPRDGLALSQVLEQLIQDASLRAKLGARGPVRARELCAPGKQVRALMQVLGTVTSRRQEICCDRLSA
jgi:glycosyltransferase involved in cell wall biosynthesis